MDFSKLAVFCDKSGDEYRHHMAAPMLVILEGAPWSVATDGRRLLAIKGTAPTVKATEMAVDQVVGPLAAAMAGVPVAAMALRAWAAGLPPRLPAPPPCARCDGKGAIKCDDCGGNGECKCQCGDTHDCKYCRGEGEQKCGDCGGKSVPPAAVGVRIGPAVLNRDFLLDLVECIDDGQVKIQARADASEPIRFSGTGWLAMIMPLREEPQGAPFELEAT